MQQQGAPVPSECARCGHVSYKGWPQDSAGHSLCDGCRVLVAPPSAPNEITPTTVKSKPKSQRRASLKKNQNQSCANCSTTSTTLWRRDAKGNTVCNACGLYYKLRGYERPVTMRKDSIQKRKRKPRSTEQRRKNSPARSTSPLNKQNGVQGSSSPSSLSCGSQSSPVQLLDLSNNAATGQSLPPVSSLDGFPLPLHHYGSNGAMSSAILTPIFSSTIAHYNQANSYTAPFHPEFIQNFQTSSPPLENL